MENQKIKCLVWDLDQTLWEGILTEDDDVKVSAETIEIIKELDERGILQSISSKNDYDVAMAKLTEFGLDQYFIYPQISWNAKSDSILAIATAINIGIDTLAFIDDQIFEREEVNFAHPQVLCIDAAEKYQLLERAELKPRFITSDSQNRRMLYQNDIKRADIEENFSGSKEEFLKTLDMKFTISLAGEEDLQRVEELTVRTHQLNSTGCVYSYEELRELIASDEHELLVAQLDDKYGTYGKIGLALIEKNEQYWEIKLLLMSCRVMARGVGSVMLSSIMNRCRAAGAALRANFIPTNRNRIMYVTYKFGGFREIQNSGKLIVFEASLETERPIPDYITLIEQ